MRTLPLLCVVFALLHSLNAQGSEFDQCDPKCVFNEGTITSKNVGSFPKCAKVCSFLIINDSSGVTEKQLTTAFKNLKVLIGSLEVQNTNYKSASFLAGLQRIESATGGVRIKENKEMLELGWKNMTTMLVYYFEVMGNDKLLKLKLLKWKTFSCIITPCTTVANINTSPEPKFCFTTNELKVLSNPGVFMAVISGKVCAPNASNKKMCTKPTAGCQELVGSLNIGAKLDAKKVKSLKFLYGGLTVKGTNLINLNLLGNLTRIVNLNSSKSALDIQNNKQLKKVKLPKLKRILTSMTDHLVIQNNHKGLLADVESCFNLRVALTLSKTGSSHPSFDGMTCEQMESGA